VVGEMIGTIGRNADKADRSKIPIDLHGDASAMKRFSIRKKGVAVQGLLVAV